MSATLLLFLARGDGFEGWLRLEDGEPAARGDGIPGPPAEGMRVVAVVPGEEVSLHWVELPPGLTPPQAAAAARLLAGDLSAEPVAGMHVAVGAEAEGGRRCVALVAQARMAEWLERCRAAGFDPAVVIPEPLLLLPQEGRILHYHLHGAPALFRGPAEAFSVEPELAAAVLPDAVIEPIDDAAFEAGLAPAIESRPVDLRQGAFGRARRWRIDWRLTRRLALLLAALLIVTAAIQFAAILRHTFAADRLEAEAAALAAAALPPGAAGGDPQAQLRRRAAQLGGGGSTFGGLASALFEAVRAAPDVRVAGLLFDERGTLRATVAADSAASLAALVQRLQGGGLAVTMGPLGARDGQQAAEIEVRAR